MRFENLEDRRLLASDGISDLVVLADDSLSFLAGTRGGFETVGSIGVPHDGKDIMVVDFDGNGGSEFIGRFQGEWMMGDASNSNGLIRLGAWADIDWYDVHTGDFNGDGRLDIAGRTAGYEWWSLQNEESGRTTSQFLGRWNANVDWRDIAFEDFTGDGITDIIARARNEWWLSESSVNGQLPHRFLGRWSDVAWTDVAFGQFTGDDRPDIAGRDPDGRWWALETTDNRLVPHYMAKWGTHTTWSDLVVADFDNDGFDDLLARSDLNEWWRVHHDENGDFETSFWAQWSEIADWVEVLVDDFTDDGYLDLVGRAVGTPAAGGPSTIGWFLTSGDDPLNNSTWLTASDIPANARTFSGTVAEPQSTVEVASATTKSGAAYELELTADHRILLTGTGQHFVGIDLNSPEGNLIPGESAVPFSFFLSNSPRHVTWGQLGDVLYVDGTIPLDVRWNPDADFSELQAVVGLAGNVAPQPITLFDPFADQALHMNGLARRVRT
jgi:hypothetical protein